MRRTSTNLSNVSFSISEIDVSIYFSSRRGSSGTSSTRSSRNTHSGRVSSCHLDLDGWSRCGTAIFSSQRKRDGDRITIVEYRVRRRWVNTRNHGGSSSSQWMVRSVAHSPNHGSLNGSGYGHGCVDQSSGSDISSFW